MVATPINMTQHYRPNWVSSAYVDDQTLGHCSIFVQLYYATLIVFVFECGLYLMQLLTCLWTVCTSHNEADRVESLVTFPFIGFIFCFFMTTNSGLEAYRRQEEKNGADGNIVPRLLGTRKKESPLSRFYVSTNWPFFSCLPCVNREVTPQTVRIRDAVFYPLSLPLTRGFYQALFARGQSCGAYCYAVWVCIVLWTVWLPVRVLAFFLWYPVVFLHALAYGDRAYVARFIHDIPNLIFAAVSIVWVQYSASAVFSVVTSGVLIVYYLSSMLYIVCCKEGLSGAPVEDKDEDDDAEEYPSGVLRAPYGPLNPSKAASLALTAPALTCCALSWLWVPFAVAGWACGCSCCSAEPSLPPTEVQQDEMIQDKMPVMVTASPPPPPPPPPQPQPIAVLADAPSPSSSPVFPLATAVSVPPTVSVPVVATPMLSSANITLNQPQLISRQSNSLTYDYDYDTIPPPVPLPAATAPSHSAQPLQRS